MNVKRKKQNFLSIFLVITILFQTMAVTNVFAENTPVQSLAEANENLIKNGGFEETEPYSGTDLWKNSLKPLAWTAKPWGGVYENPEYTIEKEEISGNNILQISIPELNTKTRGTVVSDKIQIKSDTIYELKGRLKLDNVGINNNVGIQIKQYGANINEEITNARKTVFINKGTIAWKEYNENITTDLNAVSIEIIIITGATNFLDNGTIQVDDLSLKEFNETPTIIPVEKIEMQSEIYDRVNTKHKLLPTITPSDASDKTITWSSEDTNIATVDQEGNVTLIALGNTKIKATTNNKKEAICNVVVVENLDYKNLIINGDLELTEPVIPSDVLWKSTEKPKNWTAKEFKDSRWGNPDFYLKTESGNKFIEIQINQNARGTVVSDKIKIKPNTNYKLKGRFALNSVSGNNFGIQIKQYKADGKTLAIADRVIFTKNGTNDWSDLVTEFYSESETEYLEIVPIAGATNFLTSGIIKVDDLSLKEFNVPVENIEMETDIYNTIGEEYQLNAKITPSNASNKNVIWSSENEAIVTVDQTGKVTLVAIGTTEIKATTEDGNKVAVCNVTVVDKINIDEISLQTNIELELEDSIKLVPVVKPAGLILKNLSWTSSDTSIATVENGLVNAIKEGEVIITLTTPVEYGGKSAESKIRVVPKSENLISNGGFEKTNSSNPLLPDGFKTWTPTGAAKQGIDTTQAYRGQNSYKIEAEIDTRTSLGFADGKNVILSPGIYKLSLMVKAEDIVLSNGVRLRYTINKQDGSTISNYSPSKKVPTNGWEEEAIVFEVPDNVKDLKVEIFFETGTGIAWLDNLKLEKWIPIKELKLPEEETINLESESEKTLIPILTPSNASERDLIWNTSDEKILSVDNHGKIKGNKAGTALITVMTSDGEIKSNCNVTVSGNLPEVKVTALSLDKSELTLKAGRTEKLNLTILPINATSEIIWTSSDENIATVKDGRVTSKAVGTTTITAKTSNEIVANCTVTVKEYISDEFDKIRLSWKDKYSTQKIVSESVIQTDKYWDNMYKCDSTKFLWLDIVNYKIGLNITTTARRLKSMAIAATMPNDKYYKNEELIMDVVNATMWLYENTYSEANLKDYDWFSWEIGIPQAMDDIFSLLYENFTDEEINKVMRFIGNKIMPNPAFSGAAMGESTVRPATGANLLDQAKGALMPAVLLKQADKINLCKTGILSTLDYVTEEDGFYTDGSFIQHTYVPYTGSYGVVWLGGMADITEILADTQYQLETDRLCTIIEDSFIDFMYNGAIMDMVRGRGIAKTNNDDHSGGHSVVNSIVRIANSIPKERKDKYLSLAKYWILNDTCSYDMKQFYTDLINDSSIVAKAPDEKGKEYYNMNRSVYHRNDFAYGISKSSKKIQTFELTNGENQKGWYTGDGMTYLYNDDVEQFNNLFWITVDYYKLPGTTVDTVERTSGDYQNGDGETRPNNSWAGGTTNGVYGVSGMNLQAVKSDLNLNKSWFVFDDEIVAVGSNINSQSGRDIETIIEQRKIDGNNSFIVNGEQKSTDIGWSETMTDIKWAYLQGNGNTSPIGYYFPNGETLEATREAKSGDYDSINQSGDKKQYTEKFLTMWKNHGANPQADTYVYSILPNKTPEQIEAYSNNPDTIIVAQTNDVHAVKENKLGIFGANFFSDKQTSVDYLTSFNSASVLIKENDGYLELSVSDPTFANQNTIELELNRYGLEVIEIPSNIKVTPLTTSSKVSIDVSGGSKGQTFTIKFKVMPLEITKVNNPNPVIVEFHTAIDKLELPKKLKVELSNNQTAEIPVVWSQTEDSIKYDENKDGTYIFTGTLETVSGILNSEKHTASIEVIVVPYSKETLKKVINSAQAILNNPNSTVDEIVRAMSDLSKAMLEFESQKN